MEVRFCTTFHYNFRLSCYIGGSRLSRKSGFVQLFWELYNFSIMMLYRYVLAFYESCFFWHMNRCINHTIDLLATSNLESVIALYFRVSHCIQPYFNHYISCCRILCVYIQHNPFSDQACFQVHGISHPCIFSLHEMNKVRV